MINSILELQSNCGLQVGMLSGISVEGVPLKERHILHTAMLMNTRHAEYAMPTYLRCRFPYLVYGLSPQGRCLSCGLCNDFQIMHHSFPKHAEQRDANLPPRGIIHPQSYAERYRADTTATCMVPTQESTRIGRPQACKWHAVEELTTLNMSCYTTGDAWQKLTTTCQPRARSSLFRIKVRPVGLDTKQKSLSELDIVLESSDELCSACLIQTSHAFPTQQALQGAS